MKLNVTQDKMLRWAVQGLTVLLVLVAAGAVMFYLKADELEVSLSQARADAVKENQAGVAARKKLQDEAKAASAKSAELERKLNEVDKLKILLGKIEPQLAAILETAGNAKASKPEARAASLAGLGLIGQVAHGASDEAALARLERALTIDKANCVAGLAVNLGAAKKIEVTPDCQALLPAANAASDAKPASGATAPAAPAGAPAASR